MIHDKTVTFVSYPRIRGVIDFFTSSPRNLVLGVVGLLLVTWFIILIRERDEDDGINTGAIESATDRTLGIAISIVLGIATVGVVILGNLAGVVADFPGVISTLGAGAIGYISLSGMWDIGPGMFAFIVVSMLVGAIALREV